jgi:amidase
MCGVVGIKPTLGLTSRAGVVPIAHSQDTVGPFGRTVADAAVLLGAITGVDTHDAATSESEGKFQPDYTQFLDVNGLRGARIGVARETFFGYSSKADALIEDAIKRMRDLGAVIIDPANIPTAKQMSQSESELTVLLYEFKADLNSYLSELTESQVRSLEDVIAFNTAHADEELLYFGQELLLMTQETTTLDDPKYVAGASRRYRRCDGAASTGRACDAERPTCVVY